MPDTYGWFSDTEPGNRWVPVLETEAGICTHLSIGFASKEACDRFIREQILGVGEYI